MENWRMSDREILDAQVRRDQVMADAVEAGSQDRHADDDEAGDRRRARAMPRNPGSTAVTHNMQQAVLDRAQAFAADA